MYSITAAVLRSSIPSMNNAREHSSTPGRPSLFLSTPSRGHRRSAAHMRSILQGSDAPSLRLSQNVWKAVHAHVAARDVCCRSVADHAVGLHKITSNCAAQDAASVGAMSSTPSPSVPMALVRRTRRSMTDEGVARSVVSSIVATVLKTGGRENRSNVTVSSCVTVADVVT